MERVGCRYSGRLGLLAGGSTAAFRRRANGNFRAIKKLVESIHSNHLLRFNSLHGGHRPIRSAGCNRPHGGGLVALNRVDISALGVALNRRSRNQSHIVLRVDEQFDVHELAREKSVVFVVKDGFEFQGSRGWVDDIIESQQCAGCQFLASFTVKSIHRQFLSLEQLLLNLGEMIFSDAEDNRDGLELRDHHQDSGAIGLHDISGIDQPQSHAPGDRRGDMRVYQIDLGIRQLALVIFHRAFILQHDLLLIVKLLLGDGVAIQGLLVAFQIDLGFPQNRLIVRQLSLDLRQCRLIRARIDFDERVALSNHLPFAIVDLRNLALHPAGHVLPYKRASPCPMRSSKSRCRLGAPSP